MRQMIVALAYLAAISGKGQSPEIVPSFPLQVHISKVLDATAAFPATNAVQGAQVGLPPEGFIIFWGSINGDDHWLMQCRPEVYGRESVPCTSLPIGDYKGRWVHDHINLQIVGGPNDSITRFLVLAADPKNPPAPDAHPPTSPIFDFPVVYPSGKSASDYPGFIHVYGSSTLSLPVGQPPARSNCNAYTFSAYQTSVNCTASPAREIDRGFVTVNVSIGNISQASLECEAKWRWSHCSALEPGFYYARLDKKRLIVLTHDAKGNPREIGFEPHLPDDPALQSPVK